MSTTIRVSSLAATMLACSAAFSTIAMGADAMESEAVFQVLSNAKTQAFQLKEDAERLESFTRSSASWASHKDAVNMIKDDVNAMGRLLAKLQDNRPGAASWQQSAIDRVTPVAQELATNTTAAIERLNRNPQALNTPDYQNYLEAIVDSANNLASTITNLVDYGKTKQRLDRLASKLELPATR